MISVPATSPVQLTFIPTACPASQLQHSKKLEQPFPKPLSRHPLEQDCKSSPELHLPSLIESSEYALLVLTITPSEYPMRLQIDLAPLLLSQKKCPQIGTHLLSQKSFGVPSDSSFTQASEISIVYLHIVLIQGYSNKYIAS